MPSDGGGSSKEPPGAAAAALWPLFSSVEAESVVNALRRCALNHSNPRSAPILILPARADGNHHGPQLEGSGSPPRSTTHMSGSSWTGACQGLWKTGSAGSPWTGSCRCALAAHTCFVIRGYISFCLHDCMGINTRITKIPGRLHGCPCLCSKQDSHSCHCFPIHDVRR